MTRPEAYVRCVDLARDGREDMHATARRSYRTFDRRFGSDTEGRRLVDQWHWPAKLPPLPPDAPRRLDLP